MKNFNLIKRLFMDSHEKQTPQRFARYAAMLIMLLTLGVGQMWAEKFYNVGVAAANANDYTMKVGVTAKDWSWYTHDMTKAGLTFEGNKLYLNTINTGDNGKIGEMKFLLYSGSTWKGESTVLSSWTETDASTLDNKIWNYASSSWYTKLSFSTSARFYFDASTWDETSIKLVIGHANYQKYYSLSRITNTKLYYGNSSDTWGDAMHIGVVGGTTASDGTNWPTDISDKASEYTGLKNYALSSAGAGNAYLMVPDGDAGQQPSMNYYATHYNTDALNSTQTIKYAVGVNGGTPAELTSGYVPADIAISSYKFASGTYNSVSPSSGSVTLSKGGSNYSATVTAARTATTTYTVSNIHEDYSFVGWYSAPSGGTLLSSELSYTFYPTSATTVYARFSKENNHTVTIIRYCTSTTSEINRTSAKIGEVTYSSIEAPDIHGYAFVNWSLGSGLAKYGSDALTANPIRVKTNDSGSGYTLTANYTEVLTTDWKLIGDNTTNSPFGDGYSYASGKAMSKKSGASATDKAYKTLDITHTGTWGFKVASASGSAYTYGWGTGSTYITFNRAKSGTANDVYTGEQHELKFNPDALGEYEFEVDYTAAKCSVKVTFPTAYAVTFDKGSVNGTSGSISATYSSVSFSSGTKIQSGKSVTLVAPDEKEGYTWAGWFNNNAGSGVALSTNKTYTPTISATTTLYACYTINNHSITHSASTNGDYTIKVGSAAAVNTNTTADYGTTITLASNPSTGYHFGSWTVTKSPSGSVTVSSNQFTMPDADVTVTATFTANTWYVRFNRNGGTGGSDMGNESFTYDAAAKALTTNTYTRSGYTFSGWATSQSDADAGIVTYADKATVRNLTTTANGIVDLYAVWNANTYTVSFDVNGGTASTPANKNVTFGSAYGTLPGGMTHASKTFVGWYDDPDDGEGNHITAETIVSTARDHTLYAHYENVYSVNVNFKSGTATIYPATSVNASPTSLAPTITAPEIFGYSFVKWTGSNATFGNANSATTTVNATAATTVTANYNVVPTVYFKNNLGWDSVFVSFNCSFVDGKENVPSNNGKPYYKMTQIGSSDIYYCVIPSTYTANNYAGWAWNIAFDNTNYGKTATTTHIGTWSEFYGGECVGRGDFDPKATLYIPYNGDTETRNTAKFYKTGCWMKYNSTESGYQVNMNTIVTGSNADTCTVNLTAASAGGYEFSAKIKLHRANYTYGFKLYKIYQKNTSDLWYTNTGTIYANTETLPWDFHSGTDVTSTSTRCGLHTEALGDYTITVSFGTGRPMVNVEYPTQVGDWRLAYNDLVAWSGTTHDASWYLYSRVIKAKANAVDTVSFYVSKATGANAHIELQKCTAINHSTGAETWIKQGSNLDLSSITGTGIYNFKVTQNGSKLASAAVAGGYVGNFYIRTDASDGGWTNYKNASNVMTYSEFAENNSGFTHYYMRYVKNGTNIKFCIANDYSSCLTEECIDDDFTGEYIAAYGNVRFMWDHRTNKVSRAYISGSTNVGDRFLVLEGSAKMFDENGTPLNISGLNANEMKFSDDQNWIYEATIKAKPGAKALLTAKYNNKIQYFGGSGPLVTDSVLLLGGSDTNKYKIRVVYDFKTNRLIKAFIPDGAIGTNLAIEADLMIIREHQGDAHQVTFSGSGELSKVKTVYGAMKFNKYTVNGKSKESGHASTGASRFERDLFYISFPFDVKLNEAFGFGTYGKHWIIEYYDGKGRAANGFWADSDPNWKFVTPSERNAGYTMKAFEGYILALDLDELTESSDVWNNGVENVYIYFPSSALVKDIAATNRLVTIDQTGYECTINRNTPDGDRRVKDSYWHCIGVPSFANYSSALYDTNGGTLINWSDANTDSDGDQWTTPNLPYLYEVDLRDKSLSVTSTNPFHFKATWSYLVQYEKSSIYWSNVNVTPAAIVARERKAPTNVEFRIELQQAGKKADQTFVRLTDEENITTGFDFNYDLSKEFNKNKANIYTMVTTVKEDGPSITEVAGNVQPMTEQTTVVPMGVTIAKAGEYTISIPSGTSGIGVTLVDNETGIRTNLALEDYTVALEAGTQNDRFYLEISPIKHVATGVEEITGDGSQVTGARKVMVDGILYIIKDGKVFSTQGARVK